MDFTTRVKDLLVEPLCVSKSRRDQLKYLGFTLDSRRSYETYLIQLVLKIVNTAGAVD